MKIARFVSYLATLGIKLWLDGGQLRYKAAKNALTATLRAEIIDHKAEIMVFLAQANQVLAPPIEPIARDDNALQPLSFAQQRLWFLAQLEGASDAYHIPVAFRLDGPLDVAALSASWQGICERHEALRTTFPTVDGQARQQINRPNFQLERIDLSGLSKEQQKTEVARLSHQEATRPFDLMNGPLWRVTLLRLGSQSHLLLITMHHIISDGWSIGVLIRELSTLYAAHTGPLKAAHTGPFDKLRAPLPVQYADFAVWQREWLSGDVLEQQLAYWKEQLASTPPLLTLPTDYPRPTVQRNEGDHLSFTLPKGLTDKLVSLSHKNSTTLFMTLQAAFAVLLSRYSGQEDICIGTPIANRQVAEVEHLIGFFVNTLVLRNDLSGNPSFGDFLARVRQVTLDAYQHQALPFELLVEKLQPERSLSHSPLFQVMFNLNNNRQEALSFSDVTVSPIEIEYPIAKFDLTLAMQEHEEGLIAWWEYNTDLFERATIERMASHFQTLLSGLVANPEQPISNLPILTDAERHQLLVEWNDTAADYPPAARKCIHQLFEVQVERTPDATALIFGDEQLTYRQLNNRANQLAHHLMKLGVGPEIKVGICIERSVEMVVGLLGIFKAGGAYVPLDPSYPNERLTFMLADSGVQVLLTQPKLAHALSEYGQHVVCLDRESAAISQEPLLAPSPVSPTNLAYVLYTSGSTGKPKGVAIEHKSPVALLDWARKEFTPDEYAGVLASTSICFDLSVFEIFLPLSQGGKVILAENALHLSSLPAANLVTLINTVPSAAAELVRAGSIPANVRTVCLAGEPLSTQLVQKLYQQASVQKVFDLYGPSEDTTYSTFALRSPTGPATIGRPIANTQLYLLDQHRKPVPIGVPGEIHLSGAGLARGYLNRPQLTAEKFIQNPFSPPKACAEGRSIGGGISGARLYKTGDLARYLPDGNLEFLGRRDNQVKIRGFRIELGEIEAVLANHVQVREVVVVVVEDARGKRLVAYLVPEQQPFAWGPVRAYLNQKLPDYMIPSAFVALEALPLTPNGKIDRRALPAPTAKSPPTYIAPQNEVQRQIAALWQEVLQVDKVGITDNFFSLGGHSLLATQLVSRLRSAFQVDLPLRRLFETPTIAGLAEYISAEFDEPSPCQTAKTGPEGEASFFSLVPIQPNGSKRPFFLVPGGGGSKSEFLIYAQLIHLLGPDQPVYGFYARGLKDDQPPHSDVETMAADYVQEMRTVQPEGPYLLGGECIGGKVAYEMARQLQAQGQEVAALLLMNTGSSQTSTNPLRHLQWQVGRQFQRVQHHAHQLRPLSFGKRIRYIGEKLRLQQTRRAPLTPEPLRMQRIRANYRQLLLRYTPQHPYSGPIILLISEDHYQETPTMGWRDLALGELTVYPLPGDHDSYIGEHVESTAAQLRACLEAAQAKLAL